jgi:hypothetical protein
MLVFYNTMLSTVMHDLQVLRSAKLSTDEFHHPPESSARSCSNTAAVDAQGTCPTSHSQREGAAPVTAAEVGLPLVRLQQEEADAGVKTPTTPHSVARCTPAELPVASGALMGTTPNTALRNSPANQHTDAPSHAPTQAELKALSECTHAIEVERPSQHGADVQESTGHACGEVQRGGTVPQSGRAPRGKHAYNVKRRGRGKRGQPKGRGRAGSEQRGTGLPGLG